MWLMSTFEKGNKKKIFFVSTFLDWYKSPFSFDIIIPHRQGESIH